MVREKTLRVLLALIGITLVAGLYPLISSLVHPAQLSPGDQVILGIYIPLGIFLLLAIRDPLAHRSLIVFTGWAMLSHMVVMAVQAVQAGTQRSDFPPQVIIAVLAAALIVLAPSRRPVSQESPGSLAQAVSP
jgi:hypothetical protein